MIDYLILRFLWLRERGFVQITQKTLISLFPFFLISGIIRVISLSVFSEMGYINQLFSVSDWLPTFKITGQVLINLSNFLGGLAGPLSTYFAGKYTAGHYGRSTGTAGVTSLLVSLIIGSQELLLSPLNDGVLTRINLPDWLYLWGIWLARFFAFRELVMIRLWIRTIFINQRLFVPFFYHSF